jgi:hypothetical protein
MKNHFKNTFLIVILILNLVACSSKLAEDIIESSPTLLPNPFVEHSDSKGMAEEIAQNQTMSFGFSRAPLAGFENCNHANSDCFINFDGQPIELTFEFGEPGINDIEIGLALFIDGVIQPHQVVKPIQNTGGLSNIDELHFVSPYRIGNNEKIEVTIRFMPVTGKEGQTLSFHLMVMPYPSFIPESPDQYFGIYQSAHPYDFGTIRFFEDAPTQIESPVVQVASQPIPENMKTVSENNPTGRVQTPFYYFNDGNADYISKLILKDGKANLRLQIGGGVESDFRVTIFVNHKPVMVEGNDSFIIKTAYDQIVTCNFELDANELPRFNSLYATILPTGDGFLLNPESGYKTGSILLINEDAPWSSAALTTSTTDQYVTTPDQTLNTSFSQVGLQDLSNGLVNLEISSKDLLYLSSMSESTVLLVLLEKILLIDTNSGEILKELASGFPLTTGHLISFFKLQNGIAISVTDVVANETRIRFYDSALNETMSIDPREHLNLEQDVSENCAVSESGEKLACPKGNSIILVTDFGPVPNLRNIDLSNDVGNLQLGITTLLFVNQDKCLAFVGFDQSAMSSDIPTVYGIIDLEQNQVMFLKSKYNLNEFLLQSTSTDVLFIERRHYFDRSDGNVVLYDLTSKTEKLLPFSHHTSGGRESFTVRISPSGQYLTGTEYYSKPGVNGYQSVVVRIYDAKTMSLVMEIPLGGNMSTLPLISFTKDESSILITLSESNDNYQVRLLKYIIP